MTTIHTEAPGSDIAVRRSEIAYFKSMLRHANAQDRIRYKRLINLTAQWIAGYECRRGEEAVHP